jgi:hypothetical protein
LSGKSDLKSKIDRAEKRIAVFAAALEKAQCDYQKALSRLRKLREKLDAPLAEDKEKRCTVETTVAKIGREWLTTEFFQLPWSGKRSSWSFQLSKRKLNRYRVGDPVHLYFRFKAVNGNKKRSWDPELSDPIIDRSNLHEAIGYDL